MGKGGGSLGAVGPIQQEAWKERGRGGEEGIAQAGVGKEGEPPWADLFIQEQCPCPGLEPVMLLAGCLLLQTSLPPR